MICREEQFFDNEIKKELVNTCTLVLAGISLRSVRKYHWDSLKERSEKGKETLIIMLDNESEEGCQNVVRQQNDGARTMEILQRDIQISVQAFSILKNTKVFLSESPPTWGGIFCDEKMYIWYHAYKSAGRHMKIIATVNTDKLFFNTLKDELGSLMKDAREI